MALPSINSADVDDAVIVNLLELAAIVVRVGGKARMRVYRCVPSVDGEVRNAKACVVGKANRRRRMTADSDSIGILLLESRNGMRRDGMVKCELFKKR